MRIVKTTILILLLFTSISKAQLAPHKMVINDYDPNIYDRTKTFKNWGEQEDYLTEETLKHKYIKEKFDKYKGEIKVGEDKIFFEKNFILYTDPEVKSLLTSGTLYPALLGINGFNEYVGIAAFEELPFVAHSDTAKRYRFETYGDHVTITSTVYMIELTNNKANSNTSPEDFIKGAELTFLIKGWSYF